MTFFYYRIQLSAPLIICLFGCRLIFIRFFKARKERFLPPTGLKNVPVVSGRVPIFGHGLQMIIFGEINFFRRCYSKYGPIFQIQVYSKTIVIVCENNLVAALFKAKPQYFSGRAANSAFGLVFPEAEFQHDFPLGVTYIRKTTNLDKDEVIGKMSEDTKRAFVELTAGRSEREFSNSWENELYRHITKIIYSSLCSTMPLEETLVTQLHALFDAVHLVIAATFLVPKWLIPWIFKLRARRLRSYTLKEFEKRIRTYQKNFTREESVLVNTAIEYAEQRSQAGLVEEVSQTTHAAGLVLGVLFSSASNVTTALINTIQFLSMPQHSQILAQLRQECEGLGQNADRIVTAPFLNACIVETARLSTTFMAATKTPMGEPGTNCLGDYILGEDVDLVAASGPLMMVYGNSEKYFKNPNKFWPQRFLDKPGGGGEQMTPSYISTWGGGVHLCPGKNFALYAIKITLAHLVLNFDFESIGTVPAVFNYMTPVAFGKRKVKITFKRRN